MKNNKGFNSFRGYNNTEHGMGRIKVALKYP